MRAPLVVLALLLPALAGCVGAPAQTAAVGDLSTVLARSVADVVTVIDPAGGHGEPSFGVTPDGILFANGDGGRGGGVYRSDDGGLTWERVATPVEPMPNNDPDLSVDKDGTVWFSALWIGCTSVASSRDLGETWTMTPAACNAPVSDRQYVIPTSGGTAYLYSHQVPTFWQMVAKTTDHGATWTPLGSMEPLTNALVTTSSGWGGGGFWNEAKDSVWGTWSWETFRQGWGPGYAVTRDGGATWESGNLPSMGGDRLGLSLVVGAADEAGNVYLAWGETLGDGTAIYLVASGDDGASWSDPIRVDAGKGSKVFPAITAGAPGKVAVAYYESTDEAHPDNVEGSWNVTLAWTEDALAAAPVFERGTLSSGAVKEGPICISGTTCDGDREFLDYFQVHVLPDGRVGAVFNSLLAVEGTLVEVYAATREPILG